jgi:hypothetical protein
MIDLLIKLPSRSRFELFKEKLEKCIQLLSNEINVKFIFSFDTNDQTMNNNVVRYYLGSKKINMEYFYGESKNKIDACNRDIPKEGWKVLLLMSDDMLPRKKGFDKIIYDDMNHNFPDYDGCLNYNTHTEAFKNRTMVLTVMGKKYYDRFNYIYYPGYQSIYCDNEQTDVAIKLNKLVDIDNRIISHEWNSVKDDLRKHTESGEFRNHDSALYHSRKANGFYI